MKRVIVLLTVAAVMLAMSALPALARTQGVICCKEPSKYGPVFVVNTNNDVIKFPVGSIQY